MKGEIDRKDTFKDRVLTETPKFVQKRLLFLISAIFYKSG